MDVTVSKTDCNKDFNTGKCKPVDIHRRMLAVYSDTCVGAHTEEVGENVERQWTEDEGFTTSWSDAQSYDKIADYAH
ncbi:hypothetical protein TNCV_3991831 [Trichonephila clavipes]|uniref:Uncharacterized protein n=1 Tax=Trichonephila clavipes TaxID=2585209 RepID=A0A8X6VP60_TRICX|nr:hypothetical protein TNCV_3991831 [Trichonephila clavipes]